MASILRRARVGRSIHGPPGRSAPASRPEMSPQRISIIGAGAWGTALAIVLRRAKREVLIWARTPDVAKAIRARHENPLYLPGQRLDRAIQSTADLYEAS